jgi:hypothetical protein
VVGEKYHWGDYVFGVLLDAVIFFHAICSFFALGRDERRAIAGTYGRREKGVKGLPWGWFGTMFGHGDFKTLVNNSPGKLSAALDEIASEGIIEKEAYDKFARLFRDAFSKKSHVGGIATASRLSAMKRPDIFVAVNDANRVAGQLSRESHTANQSLQQVQNAFEAARKGKKEHELFKHERDQLQKIAKQLRIEEVTRHAHELSERSQAAQTKRESLQHQLSTEEAWFARNEVVAFVRDRKQRYSKTPDNFAEAMAGLPFYDWLYSLRKCRSIPAVEKVPKTYWFQIFEMIHGIVRRTRSANLKKIESLLKKDLLETECNPHLRSYISPHWHYMTLAFADCRGKGFRRTHIPYKIMESFLDHWHTPTVADAELAKLNQLLPSDL